MTRSREADRLYKRKRRAALYERGLTAEGKPLRHPECSSRLKNKHPDDCPCWDCLYGPDGRLV